MKLTKVTAQRKQGYLNIFIDDKYSFSLSNEDYVKEHLKIGQEIPNARFLELKFKGKFTYILNRSLNFLSYRPRSEKEVKDKIKEILYKDKEISPQQKLELSKLVIEKLKVMKFLDDSAFGKWYVSGRTQAASPSGKVKIKSELLSKGLPKDLIEELIGESDELHGTELILKSAQKKLRTLKAKDKNDFKSKLASYLARKGFESELVFSVVDTLAKSKYNRSELDNEGN